jgi:hypothetical protein
MANSFVLIASYFGVVALAGGLADATVEQPHDFIASPARAPSEQQCRRYLGKLDISLPTLNAMASHPGRP